jgi:uncharacterized membrane protein YGL010W
VLHIAIIGHGVGPLFVMAKLLIALGFRRDLAIIIEGHPQGAAS